MRLLLCSVVAAAFAALAIADVNVTGNWSGTANVTHPGGETKDSTALLILKQTGSEITGSVGPHEGELYTIQKGRVDGDKITLEVIDPDGHNIKFDLKVDGDRMTGEANSSDGHDSAKAKLDLNTRQCQYDRVAVDQVPRAADELPRGDRD
jgi:hypothetical protein